MSEEYELAAGHEGVSTRLGDTGANRQQIAGQLAGAVAHDLNNMLATILGSLELMERRIGDPDRLKALIERSSDAVERAANLTSRLAQFARPQPQPRVPSDIDTLTANLMPLIVSALGRRIRVSAATSPTPVLARTDPAGIEATLLALCLAARAAISETGSVDLATQASGPDFVISLRVSGSALNPLDLAQAHRIATAANLAIKVGRMAEEPHVVILVSPASQM